MNQRYFQWIAGERRGEIVIFNKIVQEGDMTFIEFKDDSRINTDLVAEINQTDVTGKLMAEISNPNNGWKFEEIKLDHDKTTVVQDWESQVKYEVPSVEDMAHADLTGESGVVKPRPKKKKIKLIPPRPTRNKFGQIANSDDIAQQYNESIINQPKVEEKTPEKPSVNSEDPVYIMMDKAKKVDTEVDMTLTISLPSKRLFDVAAESFDDGDKKALDYIIDNIDMSEIKESLRMGIAAMYGEVHLSEVGNVVENSFPKDDPVVFNKYGEFGKKEVKQDDPPADYFYEPEAVEEPIIEAGVPHGDPSIISTPKNITPELDFSKKE